MDSAQRRGGNGPDGARAFVTLTTSRWQAGLGGRVGIKSARNGKTLSGVDVAFSKGIKDFHRPVEIPLDPALPQPTNDLQVIFDQLGLADNTIIIFSTDHGEHHGEHGLGGKSFLYEEDIRIPMIIHDPRQSARVHLSGELVVVPDLAPTVMDLCGFPVPDCMQGSSMVPLLNDESVPWRQEIFTEQLMDIQNYPRSESVRTRDWKYIRYFARTEDPAQAAKPFRGTLDDYTRCLTSTLTGEQPVYEELFDLQTDPGETTNLATAPQHRDQIAHLRARLLELAWEAKGGSSAPLTIPFETSAE